LASPRHPGSSRLTTKGPARCRWNTASPGPEEPRISRLRRFPTALLLALLVYATLAIVSVRGVGIVGEVELAWSRGRPPVALVALDPEPTWADGEAAPTAGSRAGPLVASQVRPVEGLVLGSLHLPLAVNAYTGGIADWPARATWLITGSRRAVVALNVVLGSLLIVLVHRFLRYRGTDVAAAVAALVLATDWSFLFYRKVLGGTELLLQAAGLLCLWALWSRRWGGNRHGLLALGVGIGLGLCAKLTFGLTLVALLATALLMRWDRPRMKPPRLQGVARGLLAIALLTSPLWITALHHGVALSAHVPSHDFPTLQLRRVTAALTGGPHPAREGLANLWTWLSEPVAFFGPAYGVEALPGPSPWRIAGLVLVAAGAALAWRDRDHHTPHAALLRFCSVALFLQVGLLWLVARDLHHLAQATPTLAIVAGLSLDRLAAVATPPRSLARARTALLLASPLLLAGVLSLSRTDAVVAQIRSPMFSRAGQDAVAAMLDSAGTTRLVVSDYETYGVIEQLRPDIDVVHAWPLTARRGPRVLPELLGYAAEEPGADLLVVEASQPMGYNLRPSERRLQAAAETAGVTVQRIAALDGDRAVLYRVRRSSGPPPSE